MLLETVLLVVVSWCATIYLVSDVTDVAYVSYTVPSYTSWHTLAIVCIYVYAVLNSACFQECAARVTHVLLTVLLP